MAHNSLNGRICVKCRASIGVEECPPHLTLLDRVRNTSGMTVRELCIQSGYTTSLLYQAARGEGSRRARVLIAMKLSKIPSELWPNRSKQVNERDDLSYQKGISALSENARTLRQ